MNTEAHTLFASLSHDQAAVVAAIATGPIGVDLTGPGRDLERISRRFFDIREQRWLTELPDSSRDRARRSLWAIKEAICKADGGGLRFPLPSVRVPLESTGESRGMEWQAKEVEGYAVAVAQPIVSSTPSKLTFKRLDWLELFDRSSRPI